MHTILIEYAASNIAGLDLSTVQAGDLLQLMGAFGISNFITGMALILTGWKSRQLALYLMVIIPAAYLVEGLALRFNTANYAPTRAAWGGLHDCLPDHTRCLTLEEKK
ncbi:MAG: hypothetical protein MUP11_01850 [Anaerolineales bacterium]|nr:hypothetical protein [Anaerolineales bacterium]